MQVSREGPSQNTGQGQDGKNSCYWPLFGALAWATDLEQWTDSHVPPYQTRPALEVNLHLSQYDCRALEKGIVISCALIEIFEGPNGNGYKL